MSRFIQNPFLVGAIAFGIAVILTFVVRKIARRFGYVAKPKSDRWHKKPTAMMGGFAIFLTTVIISGLFIDYTLDSLVILGASSFLFIVGLLDDIIHIKPYQKLFGQLIGVAIVVNYGLVLPWTDSQILNIAITAFWLIGITNAINLLDNMDGLAAGIAAIAATSLALGFAASNQPSALLLVSIFI